MSNTLSKISSQYVNMYHQNIISWEFAKILRFFFVKKKGYNQTTPQQQTCQITLWIFFTESRIQNRMQLCCLLWIAVDEVKPLIWPHLVDKIIFLKGGCCIIASHSQPQPLPMKLVSNLLEKLWAKLELDQQWEMLFRIPYEPASFHGLEKQQKSRAFKKWFQVVSHCL